MSITFPYIISSIPSETDQKKHQPSAAGLMLFKSILLIPGHLLRNA